MKDRKTIRLGQFLKFAGLADTGGQAKYLIQDGQVKVNGQIETRRKRQLKPGDRVTLGGRTAVVEPDAPSDQASGPAGAS